MKSDPSAASSDLEKARRLSCRLSGGPAGAAPEKAASAAGFTRFPPRPATAVRTPALPPNLSAPALDATGSGHVQEKQQAYLAVNSAAELVRDDFQSLTGRYKDVTTTVTHADGTTTTKKDTIKATCAVGDMINDIGAWFIDVNTTSTYAKTYTFSVDGYEDVSAEILVSVGTGSDASSKVYNLTATFTNGVDSEHPCRMVLTMEGKLAEERTSGDTGSTQVVTRTLEWNKAKLQKEVTG